MIPLFDLKKQYERLAPQIDTAIARVLTSGHYILGSEVDDFEMEIEEFLSVQYAVGVASGTDALIIALRALDIGPGDEVIVPAFSFWSTASAVLHVGASPVFVDVSEFGYLIDAKLIESKITPKTKAIIPVHLYGSMASMRDIKQIASEHSLAIIEDAAQAFGALHTYGYAGTIGTIGCFSFFPTKPLGCAGDGGMLVTNDPYLYTKIKQLRSHGWIMKYDPEILGYNSRLDALQAAILRCKLHYTTEWKKARLDIEEHYFQQFELYFENERLDLIEYPQDRSSARHLFVIGVKNRNKVRTFLYDQGIETGVYYPIPLYRCKPVYKPEYEGQFPIADQASKRALAIPCYAELTREQVHFIGQTIVEAVHYAK